MFTKYFNPSNPVIDQSLDIICMRRFLHQLLEKPNDFLQHSRTLVGSIILSMTYGINTRPCNDPYIKTAEEGVEAFAPLFVGAFLVDIIPILKYVPVWFPGAEFQSTAAMMRQHAAKIRNFPFEATENLMASGDYGPSFVTERLREIEDSDTPNQDIDLVKDVAAVAYLAGIDTTAATLGTFFLAMVCSPEVQKEAQAELDKVLNGRLPEHSDISSLPYLSALVKEVHRWQPVAPLGVPHLSTSDDLYNGYHIPANSIIIPNQWAMSNDERDYPEPREFKPERFLRNGKLDNSVRDPMDIAFGFGRRICPGIHLAHSTITLAAASVLSTFDLVKQVDENGREIEPNREYKPASVRQPLDFPCVIKPRSRYTADLIRYSSGLELVE
jgi:hypothetical protein